MGEYQYYEFLAIDRPLDDDEQAEVRSLSTRARITATSFVNEYHWGDFRGRPKLLMERDYDAHLYVANWGTHRLMFRLRCDLLDPDVVEVYCVGDQMDAWISDEFVVLDLTSEDHTGELDFTDDSEALLSAIVGVRAELAAGDLRRSISPGWPLTVPGSRTRTSSTATPTTISSHRYRLGWARSLRHSERWRNSSVSTTNCSRSRPRPVRRLSRSPTIPTPLPLG